MAAFIARTIKDRIAVGDDCFTLESLPDGRTKITPAPDSVTEVGTYVNKALLQPVEDKLQELDLAFTMLLYRKGVISLNDCSWAAINILAQTGKAEEIFNVGDEKTITLTTGEQITLVVLGVNHDNLTTGGKAGVTFGMKNLLATRYRMKASTGTVTNWGDSEMRMTTLPMLFEQLPDDLKTIIKPVLKTCRNSSSSFSNTTTDSLFLLSETEVFGSSTYSYGEEGSQYAYYENASKVKRLSNGTGSMNAWWLRSMYKSNSSYFCMVSTSGGASGNNKVQSQGVAFGFCI